MKKLFIILALSALACRTGSPDRKLVLYPTPTSEATQTPIYIKVTTTPLPTFTPVFIEITNTPVQPIQSIQFCVTASETVNLRPSPSDEAYPITQLHNGEKVKDLGGRSGNWMFVEYKEFQGWVHQKYIEVC